MAYVTLQDLRNYLCIESSDEDAKMQDALDSAQARIDAICHRTFEATADTVRYFDLRRDVRGRTIFFDEDLVSITTLENDERTIASTEYVLEPRNFSPKYGLTLRFNASTLWNYGQDGPEDSIKITGRWAYSLEAPATIKQATRRLAGYYFRETDSQVFQTIHPEDKGQVKLPKTEPADVRAILKPYIRPAFHRRTH